MPATQNPAAQTASVLYRTLRDIAIARGILDDAKAGRNNVTRSAVEAALPSVTAAEQSALPEYSDAARSLSYGMRRFLAA